MLLCSEENTVRKFSQSKVILKQISGMNCNKSFSPIFLNYFYSTPIEVKIYPSAQDEKCLKLLSKHLRQLCTSRTFEAKTIFETKISCRIDAIFCGLIECLSSKMA